MKTTIRFASFALVLVALIAGATIAEEQYGIEVLRCEYTPTGEQIVDVHTTAPEGCWIVGICNFGCGDEIFDMKPVNPAGFEMLAFPMAHPNNRIELVAPDGIEVLDVVFVGGGIEGLVEYD